jgi:hypothetical protein
LSLLLLLNQQKVLLVKQLLKLKKNFHQKLLPKFQKVLLFQQNQHQSKHQLELKLLLLQSLLQSQNQHQNRLQHQHLNRLQRQHLNLLNQLLAKLLQEKNQQHQPHLKRNQLELLL